MSNDTRSLVIPAALFIGSIIAAIVGEATASAFLAIGSALAYMNRTVRA